jgi:hypothetical protein
LTAPRRRLAALAGIGILGVPLAVVATAFACANLATLKFDRAGGTPGTQVSLVGRNFNTSPQASAVQVRWNSRNGKVLYEGRPVNNKLRGTFTVPQAAPGYYVVVATQTGPNGRIASGTPGRAPFKVRATSSSGAVPAAPTDGGSGPLPLALVALLAAGLLGGSAAMVARRRTGGAQAAGI